MDNFSPLRWILTVRQSPYESSRTRRIDQKKWNQDRDKHVTRGT